MNAIIYNGIISVQRDICAEFPERWTERKTDAYYQQGSGALFVLEGQPLTARNVIAAVDEPTLIALGMKEVMRNG